MSDTTSGRLTALIEENGWNAETRFFRHNLREHLNATERPGVVLVSANPEPTEAVEDIYGGGHMAQASDQGPGLAFVDTPDEQWSTADHVCVSVRLGDVLAQGGAIYPVRSVITATAWYMTLPEGSIEAKEMPPG